jgi:hypothetical protein
MKEFIPALLLAFVICSAAGADLYFNSSEPGCNGSDPSVLFCDDFEDGGWIFTTADIANPANDGWNGTPFGAPDPEGTNFGRCGGRGAAGSVCAAGSGPHYGSQGQAAAMGDFNFAGMQSVNEFYFRYYIKPLAGYVYGMQKMLSINKCCAGVGGIYFAGIGSGTGGPSGGEAVLDMNPKYDVILTDSNGFPGLDYGTAYRTKAHRTQNLGNNLSVTPGKWFAVQYHVKLNTPGQANGIWEVWVDDCGADGRGCTGTPTIRSRHTDVQYVAPGDNSLIGSLWLENWANPGSVGEEYYDQIKVTKTGPIGFSGVSAPVGDTSAPKVSILSPVNGSVLRSI